MWIPAPSELEALELTAGVGYIEVLELTAGQGRDARGVGGLELIAAWHVLGVVDAEGVCSKSKLPTTHNHHHHHRRRHHHHHHHHLFQ